jgi:hypothetical protein
MPALVWNGFSLGPQTSEYDPLMDRIAREQRALGGVQASSAIARTIPPSEPWRFNFFLVSGGVVAPSSDGQARKRT